MPDRGQPTAWETATRLMDGFPCKCCAKYRCLRCDAVNRIADALGQVTKERDDERAMKEAEKLILLQEVAESARFRAERDSLSLALADTRAYILKTNGQQAAIEDVLFEEAGIEEGMHLVDCVRILLNQRNSEVRTRLVYQKLALDLYEATKKCAKPSELSEARIRYELYTEEGIEPVGEDFMEALRIAGLEPQGGK